jgi:hypothetical protein
VYVRTKNEKNVEISLKSDASESQGCRFDPCQGLKVAFFAVVPNKCIFPSTIPFNSNKISNQIKLKKKLNVVKYI